MNARIERLLQEHLPALKALQKKLVTYSSGDISLKKLIYFLLQFETFERIEVMMKLLLGIDLLDSGRITALVKKAMSKIDPNLQKKAIYITLGGIQDSSAMVAYPLLKDIFQDESSAANSIGDIRALGSLLEKGGMEAVIFFDDNITTGTQLEDLFKELIEGSEKPEIINHPLSATQLAILKALPVKICYAVQLSQGASIRVKDLAQRYQLDVQVYAGQHDYDNKVEYGFGIITSAKEEAFAKEFLGEIARQLFADKGWDSAKVENRLLGYGNLGKLTTFYYNIPKALITPFWKSGSVNGKPWFPLLPEIGEQKKMRDMGITPDEDLLWEVEQVLKNAPANREPEINVGFKSDDEIIQTITITVPSGEWLEKTIFSTHSITTLPYENLDPMDLMQSSLERVFPVGQPFKAQTEYQRYKAAVDLYNKKNAEYYDEVKRYMMLYASKQIVQFAVANKGQAAATELKVQATVNSSEVLIGRFSDLERPTFEMDKPMLSQFSTRGQAIIKPSKPSYMSPFESPKRPPFQIGPQYAQALFYREKLVHLNIGKDDMEIVRVDSSLSEVSIPCTINYEQMPHLGEDTIIIRFEESDTIPTEQATDILQEFKSFFLATGYVATPFRRLDN